MAEKVKKSGDQRSSEQKYDLSRVDFDWVEKCKNAKELAQAYEALVEDGGFYDLTKAVETKLKTIDPAFKRKIENTNKLNDDE